jgi:hypothetical protein
VVFIDLDFLEIKIIALIQNLKQTGIETGQIGWKYTGKHRSFTIATAPGFHNQVFDHYGTSNNPARHIDM